MLTIPGINTYYGGKNGSGVYQTIINHLPAHQAYIEPFLGAGAIMRYKKLAEHNIACELDYSMVKIWDNAIYNDNLPIVVLNGCGIEYLKLLNGNMSKYKYLKPLVYADPPYLLSSRKSQRKQYKYEFTEAQHVLFLETVLASGARIAISHYENDLYNHYLGSWNKVTFTAQTRRGKAVECLYMNYPEPEILHDYNFLGSNFRQRARIRNKIKRHISRLNELPLHERNAIINAIQTI